MEQLNSFRVYSLLFFTGVCQNVKPQKELWTKNPEECGKNVSRILLRIFVTVIIMKWIHTALNSANAHIQRYERAVARSKNLVGLVLC